jgi:hypothetical protein
VAGEIHDEPTLARPVAPLTKSCVACHDAYPHAR